MLLLLGRPLLFNALEAAKRGAYSTDLILAAGVIASFVYSTISVMRGTGAIYFEVGCVVLVMVTLGRWLEATGKIKAGDALDRLARLMPETVRKVCDGEEAIVPAAEVVKGDFVRSLAGERVPVDGRIVRGLAYVDEQFFTGESQPVLRQHGDNVLAGSLNLDGDLLIESTATGTSATLERLISLVRDARKAKGRYEKLADKVSNWFVPVVGLIAVLTFVIQTTNAGLERGILQSLAVVLIACPCALGLATPLAVWSALARAAESGVIFRSGEALERLAAIRAICFDKTGTLTTGEASVTGIVFANSADDEATLAIAASMVKASTHILSRAMLDAIESDLTTTQRPIEVRTLAGRGLAASFEDSEVVHYLGNRRLMDEKGLSMDGSLLRRADQIEKAGSSVAFLGSNNRVDAIFVFEEQIRSETHDAIEECRLLGLDVEVLTGDHKARGKVLGVELGVFVKAALLPEDKVDEIAAIRKRFGAVAMVGDGVNDAPALAASDVGVALGCGTDLSRDSAAVCLLGDDLRRIPWSIKLARRTVRMIRYNLLWAFGYNAVGVGLAAFGRLSPSIAAFVMVISSMFVIANSLRLLSHDTTDRRQRLEMKAVA